MSLGTRSALRTPRSKPPRQRCPRAGPRSRDRCEPEDGAARTSAGAEPSISRAAVANGVDPKGSGWGRPAASAPRPSHRAASCTAGPICSTKFRPASVSETLRVVRLNSRTPSWRSSLPIDIAQCSRRQAKLERRRPERSAPRDGREQHQIRSGRVSTLSRFSRYHIPFVPLIVSYVCRLNQAPHVKELNNDDRITQTHRRLREANAQLDVDGMLQAFRGRRGHPATTASVSRATPRCGLCSKRR